jgi:hypothetical protein
LYITAIFRHEHPRADGIIFHSCFLKK